MAKFKVFARTFWKENPKWPNGLEPSFGPKTTIATANTEEEARGICQRFNNGKRTAKQIRLSYKYEYTQY